MMKMKRYIFLIAVMAMSMALQAVPARPGYRDCTLQDGSRVKLTLVGDEFYHYWATTDGKIAEEQADGTFVITGDSVPDGATVVARRRASARYVNRSKKIGADMMPGRVLFILVNFSDLTLSDASTAYYKSSLGDATPGAKSMYNYLKEQSNGQYVPPIDVFGPVAVSKSYSYYGANDSEGDDMHPAEMIVEACKALDDQVDFSQYDTNSDGHVDNVYVIYAGKGEADGGTKNTIWPHQYNTYSKEGLYEELDGVHILSYACSSELSGTGVYSMGTPLHEYSHVIGLPDYYATDYYSTNSTEARTPGSWSLMDAGSYNDNGKTPPNYSIYDKYYLGWLTPEVLAKDDKLNVKLTTNYGDGYQITGGTVLVEARDNNTVYYIENRQRTGWDAALPGHGMIVWKVIYKESAWEYNSLNNTNGSPRLTIVSASGNPKWIGRATDPFPGSNGVRTYTPFTGCELSEITESNGLIYFGYNGGLHSSEFTYQLTGVHCSVPANGVVPAREALSLTITPDEGYSLAESDCWSVQMGEGNELKYGKGFTYNPETGEFRIEKVLDDVTIAAEGKKLFSITWMAYGREFARTTTTGRVVLPDGEPGTCVDGKVFRGWCKTADYVSATEAPEFVQTGDAAAEGDVYYAVFATQGSGPEQTTTYKFTSKSWADASKSWQSQKDAFGFQSGKGVQITSSYSGAGATTKAWFDYISNVKVTYCTNASAGEGQVAIAIGNAVTAQKVTKDGGTDLRELDYSFDNEAGQINLSVACTANSIFVYSVAITAATNLVYTDYTTSCTGADSGAETVTFEQPATKVIRDGEVLIIRGDAVYTILGVRK